MTSITISHLIFYCILFLLSPTDGSESRLENPGRSNQIGIPWPNGRIPYEFDTAFTLGELTVISEAMRELMRQTCVQFVPHNKRQEGHHLRIIRGRPGSLCWATLGYSPSKSIELPYQGINLDSELCIEKETVTKQLLHTLGIPQEQPNLEQDYDTREPITSLTRRNAERDGSILSKNDLAAVRKLYGFPADSCDKDSTTIRPTTGRPFTTRPVTMRPYPHRAHIGHAHLYSETAHNGIREDFNTDYNPEVGCKNLRQLAGKVKSIHTYNSCVRVYHDLNCEGQSIQFHPWSKSELGGEGFQSHWNVGSNWQRIRSIGPCTMTPPHTPCPSENFQCQDGRCVLSVSVCSPTTIRPWNHQHHHHHHKWMRGRRDLNFGAVNSTTTA